MNLLNKIEVTVQQNFSTGVFELIVESSDGNQHNVQLLITDQSNYNVVYNNTFTVNPPETVPLNFGEGTYLLSFDIDGELAYVMLTISDDLSSEPIIDPYGGIVAIIAGLVDEGTKHKVTYNIPNTGPANVTISFKRVSNGVIELTPPGYLFESGSSHTIKEGVTSLTSGIRYEAIFDVNLTIEGESEFTK